MKVLIADDDVVSRTLMIEILKSAQSGYDILSVENGDQAWTTLESNPDTKVAILDLAMPGLDGFELLKRIRGDARFAHLPVIICTGSSDRATVQAAVTHGVRDFLVKPVTRTSVLEKVWNVCRPASQALPVLKDLSAARQRYEIDRDTHRELMGHFVRSADVWAADARRTTEFPRVRALAIRAGYLKQMLGGLGAAAVAARFQEAEDVLGLYKTKPLANDLPTCLRKAQQLGDKLQPDIDRLREVLDTIS